MVAAKFADMKEEFRGKQAGEGVGGMILIMKGEVALTQDNLVTSEDPHDGNSSYEQIFN